MTEPDGRGPSAEGWGTAAWKAALMLVVAAVGFVLVPDRLMQYLPNQGVSPRVRDLIVTGWTLAWFVAASYLFVRIQRRRSG